MVVCTTLAHKVQCNSCQGSFCLPHECGLRSIYVCNLMPTVTVDILESACYRTIKATTSDDLTGASACSSSPVLQRTATADMTYENAVFACYECVLCRKMSCDATMACGIFKWRIATSQYSGVVQTMFGRICCRCQYLVYSVTILVFNIQYVRL